MAEVVATAVGYYGGIIRNFGDRFEVADDIMADEKRRPKWVKLAGARDPEPEVKADEAPAKGKGRKPKAEPFDDAPEPVRVENEINKATGSTAPDWVAPKPID